MSTAKNDRKAVTEINSKMTKNQKKRAKKKAKRIQELFDLQQKQLQELDMLDELQELEHELEKQSLTSGGDSKAPTDNINGENTTQDKSDDASKDGALKTKIAPLMNRDSILSQDGDDEDDEDEDETEDDNTVDQQTLKSQLSIPEERSRFWF